MKSKLANIVDNIKNVKTKEILTTLKKSKVNINGKNVVNLASSAIDKAKLISKEELSLLLSKVSKIEKKTSAEIEKIVYVMVNKLLKDKSKESVSEDVKKEIVNKLTQHGRGKNIIPILKYMNKIIITNVPKSVSSVKNFKNNVSLEGKNVA